jgi:tripartite-type tricarboxylate transporter receptor subunit TctC
MLLATLFAFAVYLGLDSPLSAQSWPTRAVTIVTPYSVGGPLDVSSRALAAQLQKQLGQPFVVLNKPGAGGNIGADFVAKSKPDGYTLVMGANPTNAINPSLIGVPYDPIKDFRFVTLFVQVPNVLVVSNDLPVKNVQEFIAYLKAHPGSLEFAGTTGSPGQLSGELFMASTKTDMLFVPYPGSAPALNDLLTGRVRVMFDNLASALPHIKSGKIRALAVTTSRRSEFLPDVPTLEESGLSGFDMSTWWGVLAPGQTPEAIVQQLNSEILKAMKTPEIQRLLSVLGSLPISINTPEQFTAFVTDELALDTKLVQQIKGKKPASK